MTHPFEVVPEHKGEYLVLDIESGDCDVDPSERVAFERAPARSARGVFCILRIGHPTAHRLGAAAACLEA